MFYAIAITVISLTAFIISIIRLRAEMRFMDAQVNAIRTSTDMLMQVSNTIGFTPTSSVTNEASRKLSHIWIVLVDDYGPYGDEYFNRAFETLDEAVEFCRRHDWHYGEFDRLIIAEYDATLDDTRKPECERERTIAEWDCVGGCEDYFLNASFLHRYSQNDFN